MKKEGKILDHGKHPEWGIYLSFLEEPIWEYDVEEKLLEKFPERKEAEAKRKFDFDVIGTGLAIIGIGYGTYWIFKEDMNMPLAPLFYVSAALVFGTLILGILISGLGNPIVTKYAITERYVLFKMRYVFGTKVKALALEHIERLHVVEYQNEGIDIWLIAFSNVHFNTYAKSNRNKYDFPVLEGIFDYDFPLTYLKEKIATNRK